MAKAGIKPRSAALAVDSLPLSQQGGCLTVCRRDDKWSCPRQHVHCAVQQQSDPQPSLQDNDVQLAWVGHLNWTYSRDFECKCRHRLH